MREKSGKSMVLALVFSIAMLAMVITLLVKGAIHGIILGITISIIFFLIKNIWLPEGYGRYKIRIMSLGIASAAVLSFGFWSGLVENVVKSFIQSHFPEFASKYSFETVSPYVVLVFLVVNIWIVNYFNRDKTTMKIHPTPIEEDIPELPFIDKFKGVCNALGDDLRCIDFQTNWCAQLFTPLDAEVEIDTGNRTEKKVTDLLKAIKESKENLILVLGDPGAGKSVALRKLAQDLVKESIKTGKIPVYINLNEWSVEKKWDEKNPPTVKQLYDFVTTNLQSGNISVKNFFSKYFECLYESGRLYFILDSFDEIPAILDEREDSQLIRQLSRVIFEFLKGSRVEGSQGILASRIFRKPTREFQTNTILEIRPFTEAKIIETFKRSGQYSEELIHRLFKERIELVPVARNPFSAMLISKYVENNSEQLPANQTEMYSSYIDRSLDSWLDLIEKKKLNKEKVIACSIEIADRMFREYGLEAPVNRLRKEITDFPVEDVIEILIFTRIGRKGTGDENRFSFVHRRFTEYFAVQKIIRNNNVVDLESIPTDSQWRDALVLYCEIVNESKATAIAEFCWDVIKHTDNPQDLRVIHCMRFLRDAFKGRLECIRSFRDVLAEYIYRNVDKKNNMVSVKLAVETVGLLDDNDIDRCIEKAMGLGNYWINESAFKSCRHLPSMSNNLEEKIIDHLDTFGLFKIVEKKNELKFSLSLSDGLKKAKRFLKLRFVDAFLFFAIFLMISFLFPGIGVNLAFFCMIPHIYLEKLFDFGFFYGKFRWVRVIFPFLLLVFLLAQEVDERQIVLSYSYISNEKLAVLISSILILCLFPLYRLYIMIIKVQKISFSMLHDKIRAFLEEKDESSLVKVMFRARSYRWIGNYLLLTFISLLMFRLLIGISVENYEEFLSLIFAISLLLVLATFLMLRWYRFFAGVMSDFIKIKNLNPNKFRMRNSIYALFITLRSEWGRERFVTFLEKNIKAVKGDWPAPDIMQISRKKSYTRLAQLEEMWLKIEQ